MAFANSALNRQFVADQLGAGLNFDLNAPTATYKVALYNNSVTPDKDATAANYAYNAGTWVIANEVAWPAGGQILANLTITTPASGVIMFDADDRASAAGATLSGVYGSLLYNDSATTPVAKQGVCHNYFGGANSVTNGVLTIVWNANGLFRVTV